MSKPVDLIVANTLHEIAAKIASVPEPLRVLLADLVVEDSDMPERLARKLLCDIADSGTEAAVLRALGAVGAPSTRKEITQRLNAVREQRSAPEFAAEPASSPAPDAPRAGADDPVKASESDLVGAKAHATNFSAAV